MASLPPFDLYEVLGVSRDADQEAIKKAHRKLMIKCHPDRIQDEGLRAKANDMFHKLQRSYEILVDPTERRRYDNQLRLAELKAEQIAENRSHKTGHFATSRRFVEISELKKERLRDRVDVQRPASFVASGQEKRYKDRELLRRAASSFVDGRERKSSDGKPPVPRPTTAVMQQKTNSERTSVQRAPPSVYDNRRNSQGDQARLSLMRVDECPHAPSPALSDPTPYGFSSKRHRHTPGYSSTQSLISEPDFDYENPNVIWQVQPKSSRNIDIAHKGGERLAKEGKERANERTLSWLNPFPKPATAFPNLLLHNTPLFEYGSGKQKQYLPYTLTAAAAFHDRRKDVEDGRAIEARNRSPNPGNKALNALMGVQNALVPVIESNEKTLLGRNVSTLKSWEDLMRTAELERDLENLHDKETRDSISSAISTGKIDAADAKSWTALHYAAGNGISSAVDWLLREGADIHSRTSTGYEPLHVAIEHEQLSSMRILLEHGADFNGEGRSKGVSRIITPIELAVSRNKEPFVRLLLQRARDSTLINEQYALRWAAECGDFDIVRQLLEHGADPNSSNDDGCGNALHGACKKGRTDVVRLLLEYKADANAKAFYDHIVKCRTAMYIAQKEGHESVVSELELAGVELSPEISSKDPGIPRRNFRDRMKAVDKLGQVPGSAQSNDQTAETGLIKSRESGTMTRLEPIADINADAPCEMKFIGSEYSRMSSSRLPIILKVQKATENNDPAAESTDISESSFSGSDHSDEDGCHIVPWKTQELIERIMTEFYSLFLPRWTQNGIGQVKCGHGSKSGSSCRHIHSKTASASTSQIADSSTGNTLLKRGMNDRDWPSGGSEDEGRKRSKPLPAPREDGVNARKFACPFFKFDPNAFSQYGSCTGPGFKSVSRVKEHLYRRHQRPLQCPRCWTDMRDNQELETHLRLTSQCELRSRPLFLGISPRKLELLKTKKRRSSEPGEEGKWRDVFRILFPGADIPCPYYEPPTWASNSPPGSDDLETFQEFARVQLPLLVEAKYESKIQQNLHPLEEEFKRGLGETVRTALTELFKTWQEKSPRGTPHSSGEHSRTSSNRSTERISSGFMSMVTKMDELPSVFPDQPALEPLGPEFPLEQGLSNASQSHRISDSVDSDYSFLVYDYRCICNSLYGMPSFLGLDDGLATGNLQTVYHAHHFTSTTGSDDMSFMQAQGLGHDEMLDYSEGKGKARQEDTTDHSPRFCSVCYGTL